MVMSLTLAPHLLASDPSHASRWPCDFASLRLLPQRVGRRVSSSAARRPKTTAQDMAGLATRLRPRSAVFSF